MIDIIKQYNNNNNNNNNNILIILLCMYEYYIMILNPKKAYVDRIRLLFISGPISNQFHLHSLK